jgi:hypothetical protein
MLHISETTVLWELFPGIRIKGEPMSSKFYTQSENRPDSLWGVNEHINSNGITIPSEVPNNKIDENRDKFREEQRKWHLSKLEGYVSDEFRNIEFAD